MGVKFTPFSFSVERYLQVLAAAAAAQFMAFGGLLGIAVLFFAVAAGQWLAPLLYLTWMWVMDTKTCDRGGRRVECVRGWTWWKYLRDYFPVNLKTGADVELDPKRNYLFCAFPHGMLATGVFTALGTNACGFQKLFPDHKTHLLTLKQNFKIPLYREFLLGVGMCSASAKSINWLLRHPAGGNAAVLVVGGAAESFYCRPGQYQLVLKNRKGFVKLALKNGSPLVPVFSFGETDIFDQFNNPEGSVLRRLQEFIKKLTGVAPVIPCGRGFFQNSYGIIPRRKPITVIIGRPIEVDKTEKPTEEQIDEVHTKFIEQLTELFEEHKHKYVENPDKTKLFIS